MNLAAALRAGFRLPFRRGRSVLPFYLLAGSVGSVARLPLLLGVVGAYLLLASQGRIDPVFRELDALDRGALDPAEPSTLPPGLDEALAGLATPAVGALLLVALFAFVVLAVVLGAAARAGTTAAVYAGIGGRGSRDAPAAGVGGLVDYWRQFLGLWLLRAVLTALALAPLGVALAGTVGIVAGGGVGVGNVGVAVALLLVLLAGLLSLVLALAVSLAFAFAGPAVVVDEVGTVSAVRRSLGFVRRRPGAVAVYVVVVLGAFVAFAAVTGLASVANVPRFAALLGPLFLSPALDGFKLGLYADLDSANGRSAERAAGETTRSRPRLRAGIRGGVGSLWAFLRGHPLANVASAALLAAAVAAGYAATAPYGTTISPPGDVAGVFGAFAVGPFLNIAANNWLVSTSLAYGGLALGLGPVSDLAFNGLLIGALAGVFDRAAFFALVAPHGVVELPAIAVAGGLGLHLGRVGWGWLRGRRSRASVGSELTAAFDVLVGLAVVLVVASFIEAFLTPRIAAYLLGG